MPQIPVELLTTLSGLSTLVILAVAAVHLVAFVWLSIWARVDLRRMAGDLDSFTRELKHRGVLYPTLCDAGTGRLLRGACFGEAGRMKGIADWKLVCYLQD